MKKRLTLASIVALAFSFGTTCYAEDVNIAASVNNAYSLIESTESDYNFSTYSYNEQTGETSTNYYKIDFNLNNLTTSGNVTWQEVSESGNNTVQVTLPNNDTRYLKWTYTNANNYTEATERINNTVTQDNVNNVYFHDISSNKKSEIGAVYNYNTDNSAIDIVADFYNNSTSSGILINDAVNGTSNIGSIVGDFVANKPTKMYSWVYTGIIANSDYNMKGGAHWSHTGISTMGDITGSFIGNDVNGGHIYNGANECSIGNITGIFIGNNDSEYIGIIHNIGTIENIVGDFIGNSINGSYSNGVAIDNQGILKSINGSFVRNNAKTPNDVFAGAIFNTGTIESIKGLFVGNYIVGKTNGQGGAIDMHGGKIYNLEGDFIGNYGISETSYMRGGALHNSGNMYNIVGNYSENHVQAKGNAQGGAISNSNTIGKRDDEGNLTGGITNSNFYGNYAKSESGTAQGGAIWTSSNLNIIADNGTSTFQGNYVQSGESEKDYQAIWVDGASTKLNLQQFNNGKMYMYDNINGTDGYTVNIQGDGTGTYYMFNDIKNANVGFDNTTINTVNNDIHTYEFNSLALNSNTNFVADVDLVNEQMDHIETGNNYTIADGAKLTVSGMNLLNDAEKDSTKIFFAEEGLANSVDTTVKTVSYSPIYKYDVNYLVDEDNKGYFTFARSASGGSDGYNPSVLASPVATQTAAQVTMEHTFNYSFSNSDTFMLLPKKERIAIRNRNKYAIAENELPDGANPLYQMQDTSSAWFKPYASFENVPLKNGPKVNVISYGALAGYDTDLKELKRGWARAWTGYVGYNGANLNYNGVTTTQNGGILGGTLTMYKGNFFNATTLSAGATVGENSTMYGHDTTTSLLAGIGNKTGYNLEFIDGKFIVQPSLFLGYTFVKTFDYTNAAGVRIDSDPSHTMQISPGLKFIGNLKHGWQPYIGVNMVWNVLNNSHVKANSVTLPQMSVKPYIQYGIGLQKTVKDNFVAYGQAMVQNGGRNGISLTAGFRWAIGKNHKPIEKVQNNSSDKKVMKSSTENKNQKIANNINPKMSKVQEFFAKMNGEPTKQSAITTSKAVISKI